MADISELTADAEAEIAPAAFAARAILVALQFTLVIYLGQSGVLFFYQLF